MQKNTAHSKGGAKNDLTPALNTEISRALDDYYVVLESHNAIAMLFGSHLPKACLKYSSDKQKELLSSPAFANLSHDLMSKVTKVFYLCLFHRKFLIPSNRHCSTVFKTFKIKSSKQFTWRNMLPTELQLETKLQVSADPLTEL